MRCSNCGWTNPDGVIRCEKCNQPLAASHPVVAFSNNGNVCPNCGNSVRAGEDRCPQCGYMLSSIQHSSVSDNPNNRATTMAGPVNNPDGRATVMAVPMSNDGTRATVMATPSYAPKPMMAMPVTSQPSPASCCIRLSCMDDASHAEITIQSAKSLAMHPGEIILIAGLRYIVK